MKNYKWWNNGVVNKRSNECPGSGYNPGRVNFTRKPHTQETLEKIKDTKSRNKQVPWNKGKKGIYSEETLQKMSSAKQGYKPSVCFEKGTIPWNKGLTAETDTRIQKYTEKQKGSIRQGNYVRGCTHPNYNPKRTDFQRYRQQVALLSEKNYKLYNDEINPQGHPRALMGVDGGWQLDHIISVYQGFNQNMPVNVIAGKDNLQMLPWEHNRKKGYT